MKARFTLIFMSFVFLSLVLPVFVSAITGSIGNARMVLKAEVGDTIEKYVLVKNVNNEPINISLFVSGDLEKDVNLKDKGFILQPGEERKAYFTIKPRKAGTYETRINVQFSSLNQEGTRSGVGLSSTILLNVYGEGELPEEDVGDSGDVGIDESDNEADIEGNETNPSKITGAFLGSGKTIPLIFSLITTLILVVLLIFMISRIKKLKRGKLKKGKRADRGS